MRVTPQCDSINSFIISQTDSFQADPAVDFDGNNFVVLWDDATSGNNKILAARVTPAGTVLDAGNHIGQTGVNELYPDIVFNGANYYAVWCHYSAPYGVCGRFVTTDAQPSGTITTIALTETYKYVCPKIAYSGSNYLVVWADMQPVTYNMDISGQLVSTSGTLIGSKIVIANESSPEMQPYVVFDGVKYLVAWNDSGSVRGRFVDTLGQCVGSSFPISETAGQTRSSPWISVSDSNFLVVWEEDDVDQDIYGNVDLVIGLVEHAKYLINGDKSFPWIITGSLPKWQGRNYRIFDITGRTITSDNLQKGVYFIEFDDGTLQKVIKIR